MLVLFLFRTAASTAATICGNLWSRALEVYGNDYRAYMIACICDFRRLRRWLSRVGSARDKSLVHEDFSDWSQDSLHDGTCPVKEDNIPHYDQLLLSRTSPSPRRHIPASCGFQQSNGVAIINLRVEILWEFAVIERYLQKPYRLVPRRCLLKLSSSFSSS